MKTNEAPEKIYVDSKAIGDNISTTVHTWPQDYPTCVEYTRTDAFIEKACIYLEPIIFSMNLGDRQDTDKFIDNFKKYMKGEHDELV